MKPLSRNDLLLMGFLVERPLHGYELAELLAQPGLAGWVKMGRTSVYYSLGRLERDELVTKHVERHGDKPERSVYSITDEGRAAFFRALEDTLRTASEAMSEFDIAIYYANRLESTAAMSALEERIQVVTERVADTVDSLSGEDGTLDVQARLVLEHRLTILRAERSFLEHMIELFTADRHDHHFGSLAGSLTETMLHEVLRTLASAKRSGTLRVKVTHRTVEFALHRGELYGIAPDSELGELRSLETVFSAGRGEYEFMPADKMRHDVVDVGGLDEAILKGCRAVSASDAFQHVLPDPQTLLALSEGAKLAGIDLVLTDLEEGLLRTVDGVKSVSELARRLRVNDTQLVKSAFALWAVGWLIRTGREKRDLVSAVTVYAQRWIEAVELFAGGDFGSRTALEVDTAVSTACPSRFPLGTGDISMFDYPETRSELSLAAAEFIECLLNRVAGLLGEGFVRDVMNGYAAQLSASHTEVLIKNQAAPDRVLASLEIQPAGYSRRRQKS